jgi:hypothetical protein
MPLEPRNLSRQAACKYPQPGTTLSEDREGARQLSKRQAGAYRQPDFLIMQTWDEHALLSEGDFCLSATFHL